MNENMLQSVKENFQQFWSQVQPLFDFENSSFLETLKPYLGKALENPLATAIAFLALIGIPFTLTKIRKNNTEAGKRLDKLIEELEAFEGTQASIKEKAETAGNPAEPIDEEPPAGPKAEAAAAKASSATVIPPLMTAAPVAAETVLSSSSTPADESEVPSGNADVVEEKVEARDENPEVAEEKPEVAEELEEKSPVLEEKSETPETAADTPALELHKDVQDEVELDLSDVMSEEHGWSKISNPTVAPLREEDFDPDDFERFQLQMEKSIQNISDRIAEREEPDFVETEEKQESAIEELQPASHLETELIEEPPSLAKEDEELMDALEEPAAAGEAAAFSEATIAGTPEESEDASVLQPLSESAIDTGSENAAEPVSEKTEPEFSSPAKTNAADDFFLDMTEEAEEALEETEPSLDKVDWIGEPDFTGLETAAESLADDEEPIEAKIEMPDFEFEETENRFDEISTMETELKSSLDALEPEAVKSDSRLDELDRLESEVEKDPVNSEIEDAAIEEPIEASSDSRDEMQALTSFLIEDQYKETSASDETALEMETAEPETVFAELEEVEDPVNPEIEDAEFEEPVEASSDSRDEMQALTSFLIEEQDKETSDSDESALETETTKPDTVFAELETENPDDLPGLLEEAETDPAIVSLSAEKDELVAEAGQEIDAIQMEIEKTIEDVSRELSADPLDEVFPFGAPETDTQETQPIETQAMAESSEPEPAAPEPEYAESREMAEADSESSEHASADMEPAGTNAMAEPEAPIVKAAAEERNFFDGEDLFDVKGLEDIQSEIEKTIQQISEELPSFSEDEKDVSFPTAEQEPAALTAEAEESGDALEPESTETTDAVTDSADFFPSIQPLTDEIEMADEAGDTGNGAAPGKNEVLIKRLSTFQDLLVQRFQDEDLDLTDNLEDPNLKVYSADERNLEPTGVDSPDREKDLDANFLDLLESLVILKEQKNSNDRIQSP